MRTKERVHASGRDVRRAERSGGANAGLQHTAAKAPANSQPPANQASALRSTQCARSSGQPLPVDARSSPETVLQDDYVLRVLASSGC